MRRSSLTGAKKACGGRHLSPHAGLAFEAVRLNGFAATRFSSPQSTAALRAMQYLQPSGYIDPIFVAGAYAGRGVVNALMAHIHQRADNRGITQLFADVSLTAEPFFSKNGFVVEAREQVEVRLSSSFPQTREGQNGEAPEA